MGGIPIHSRVCRVAVYVRSPTYFRYNTTSGDRTFNSTAATQTLSFDSAGHWKITWTAQNAHFNFKDITQYATGFRFHLYHKMAQPLVSSPMCQSVMMAWLLPLTAMALPTKLGMVALAKFFSNPQGLTQIGDTSWKESLDSGEAVPGVPGNGTFGNINSSALESSNTDLSSELVDLISAQRNYQANSRALEVNSTLQDTILQIR